MTGKESDAPTVLRSPFKAHCHRRGRMCSVLTAFYS
eukprot:CAMPEP_0174294102 /NCGR_PEP_ID=MMETSP0809-20121228/40597_1 /TAXON_ID=73025 ORGANISM="Eutreptiella gymnastica-like, Strain CCMP1594" /NCGR_SAMPLE_ID=MMETSP0809 /ASSEMBLY_ACC=CAM_ASM_000658 /LENGTH=35 /DNA_ID= /DNA_START= /DNA_END= /DNA_ORIENTATION=